MKYQLIKSSFDDSCQVVKNFENNTYIPLHESNTDYANFKKEILDDEAQLQDAEGNTMTPEQAKEFIKDLP